MGTQLFDEVIGVLPPSTVDVAGIVRREKRRGMLRTITGAATATVALSVAVAIGLSGTGGAKSPPSATGSALASDGPPATGVPAPDTRFRLVADSAESAAATAKRLSKALDASVRKEVPGSKWIFEPDYVGEPKRPDGQLPDLDAKVRKGRPGQSGQMFAGVSGVRNDGRKGSFHLIVVIDEAPEDGPSTPVDPGACGADTGSTCTEGTAPNGAWTRLVTMADENGGKDPFVLYIASVGLPDGRYLILEISNDFGLDGAPAAQPDAPWTSDQLLTIATDLAGQIKA